MINCVYFFALLSFLADSSTAKTVHVNREKRDPGSIITTTGLIAGVIGNIASRTPVGHPTLPGGCEWFGSAPFCNGQCPPGYDNIRMAMYSPRGEKENFGGRCLLGRKSFCCRPASTDCNWGGTWTSGKTGINYYCHYEMQVSTLAEIQEERANGIFVSSLNCGTLRCKSRRPSNMAKGRVQIGGERCETLYELFGNGTTAVAVCGYMEVNEGDIDYLYKSG